MNRKIRSLLVLTIVLASGIAAAQDQPINPPGFYGSITVNGQPAQTGTTITAKIGGAERGFITTSLSGLYGDGNCPPPDSCAKQLWITGYKSELNPPATISFYVSGVAAQQTAQLTGPEILQRLDLTFIGVPTPTPTSVGGAPGGGGSGSAVGSGGNIISGEPSNNIEFSEIQQADLKLGIPVIFSFKDPRHVVYELVITTNISAGLTSARIEQLKDISKLVTMSPSGDIYKNANIMLGVPGFAVPRNILDANIRFRVSNDWLSRENVDANQVSMMKWDGSKWITLETKQMKTDDKFAYYEAKSNSFSPFAISGVKAAITQATPTPGVSPTAAPLGIVPPPTTSLSWILYVIVAIIIIAAVYYYTVKKK